MEDKKKLVERVLKLFSLGDASRNPSEAEVNSAVTKARELMLEYAISEADLQAYGTDKAKQVAVLIKEEAAYTLRRSSFAVYDQYIANTVDVICDTKNYTKHAYKIEGGRVIDFVSRQFYGAEADVAVAVALFNRLMDTMKNMAKQEYGTRWSTPHSSFCIGLGSRVLLRAQQLYADPEKMLVAKGKTSAALMIRDKRVKVQEYTQQLGLTHKKMKAHRVQRDAYDKGHDAGGRIDLGDPKRRLD